MIFLIFSAGRLRFRISNIGSGCCAELATVANPTPALITKLNTFMPRKI